MEQAELDSPADLEESTGPWCKRPSAILHWRDWGEDSVAFEVSSGRTLQLTPLTAGVMAAFEQKVWSMNDLVVDLTADLGATNDGALRSAIAGSVRQLLELGWIVPVSPA